jgi:hypothetical protein
MAPMGCLHRVKPKSTSDTSRQRRRTVAERLAGVNHSCRLRANRIPQRIKPTVGQAASPLRMFRGARRRPAPVPAARRQRIPGPAIRQRPGSRAVRVWHHDRAALRPASFCDTIAAPGSPLDSHPLEAGSPSAPMATVDPDTRGELFSRASQDHGSDGRVRPVTGAPTAGYHPTIGDPAEPNAPRLTGSAFALHAAGQHALPHC